MDMASTSVAIASSSPAPIKNYEVFINFRGEDTRATFTSHLHAALCRSYVETYIDYKIDKGDEVWPELEKAIKDSSLVLVVFSQHYASSTWCLNELVEIMECHKKNGQDVIPVFYQTDPSHVRKQKGSYQAAFEKHKKHKYSEEKMQKWKDALSDAANISGFHSSSYRTDSDLIEDIIKAVLRKLDHKCENEHRRMFILDENYSRIESLIKVDSENVRTIGIWGMGGIGKTSLAAAIFHEMSSQYEGSCFLENVTKDSERHGTNNICNTLLSKLLREDPSIDTAKVIPSFVKKRLRRMKAFVVLDDVKTSKLLKDLVGEGCSRLGASSRVIVTTRDKQVLISGGVDEIHEVKEMNFENSLRLFSLNAFNKTYPEKGYKEVSKKAIAYAKGIPLALKVLGSFLHSKSKKEWDSALNKLKENPNPEIQKVLRLSYDELDVKEKNIFLDIACFFRGCRKNKVTNILNACGFFADIGIRNLLDKALITIYLNNCIQMHNLIQEMGREIVREESPNDLGRRSRLWDPKEVCDVLTNNRGTGAVEVIWLDMTQITHINLSSRAFKKMPNLRFLAFQSIVRDSGMINHVYLKKDLALLPKNLIYFQWDGYPSKSLPSTFRPEKLVELSLSYSNVEKLWIGVQNLPSLETIDLSNSRHLIECPNFSRAPNLKHVILGNCESLPQVDPSINTLRKLEVLDVSGCKSLQSLCSSTCSPSLRRIHAAGCFNLQELTLMPTSISGPSITSLYLEGSGLKNELSSSTLHIGNLKLFSFTISERLMDLPENFADEIHLCESRQSERDTFITLHKVLSSPCLRYVRRLLFLVCRTLFELPDNISLLSSLEYLALLSCAVTSLPESIKYLPRLKFLEVVECQMLQSVPTLPQSIQGLFVLNCESLQDVLTSTSEPSKKPNNYTLLLPNCINLDQHSCNAILKDAIVRIELGAKLLLAEELENKEDASLDDDDDDDDDYCYYYALYLDLYIFEAVRSGKICYLLPAGNFKLGDWFHHHSTQALITIELPPNHLGFIFYLVLSQVQSFRKGYRGSFGCECYLETRWGEKKNIKSFFVDECSMLSPYNLFNIKSDHVLLWYDAQCCKQIMEAIKEINANDSCTTHNTKLTLKFFARTPNNNEAAIKECGFRWIYSLEDHIVEEGKGCECERCRETQEVEDSESDEQEEKVPPTKNFMQNVFGTPSSIEVEETKDLRSLLEELLHIGFVGDFMPITEANGSEDEW